VKSSARIARADDIVIVQFRHLVLFGVSCGFLADLHAIDNIEPGVLKNKFLSEVWLAPAIGGGVGIRVAVGVSAGLEIG